MLNDYWAHAVPVVLGDHGGMIERFAGDAIMVVFNAAADQPDHAAGRRAASPSGRRRTVEGNGDLAALPVGIAARPSSATSGRKA
jgi:class 3 adenylate cyclase